MSERNNPLSFDYELTGGTDGAALFHDGDRFDTQNPYRTPGISSQKIGHEVALADAARIRPERLPSLDEQKVLHIGDLSWRLANGFRTRGTQADILVGGE